MGETRQLRETPRPLPEPTTEDERKHAAYVEQRRLWRLLHPDAPKED